jgi:hypothetical protein
MLGANAVSANDSSPTGAVAQTGTGSSAAPATSRGSVEGPQGIELSAEALKGLAGECAFDPRPGMYPASGMGIPPIEVTADQEGLWVDAGVRVKRRLVALFGLEFAHKGAPPPENCVHTRWRRVD